MCWALLAAGALLATVPVSAGCAGRGRGVSTRRGPSVFVRTGKIETITPVTFEFNSAKLRPEGERLLDEVAAAIRSAPQVRRVRIEGHTDEVGGREYNLELSRRRAESVKRYLMRRGIAGSRLLTVGYGRDRPVADNSTEAGRAQNRRVEFILVD